MDDVTEALRVDRETVPRLKPGVRLQFNEARQQWIVQAPERVLMPDEIAVAVLKRCDGVATVAAIGEALAREYDAPPEVVTGDVVEMLQDLADKGVIGDAGA
jgi:pyrroloquinoline quinone biosynthesis protein D